jgi:eukaryotic-like serine/threonine-protein kinase
VSNRHTRPAALPASIGRYRVTRSLSDGATSRVLRVEEFGSERTFALKLQKQPVRPELVTRMRNELHALHEIADPHVIAVRDQGEHEGAPYLVMDLIDGVTLDRFVDPEPVVPLTRPPPDQTTPEQQTLLADPARIRRIASVITQTTHALRALHARDILHRDLQPAHLLVDRNGFVTLIDLSLVARVPYRSADGVIIGSFDYLAPEQALGADLDLRADLYNLGVVLFVLLAGRHPFYAENSVGLAYHHARKPPPSIMKFSPHAPAELCALTLWLLEKTPDRRPANVNEVITVLERFDPDAALLTPSPALRDWRPAESLSIDDDVGVLPPARPR